MRAIVFQGKFGYLKNKFYKGAVIFCHFEETDRNTTLAKAARKFARLFSSKLILVPFTHLHEKCANKTKAQEMFAEFSKICISLKPNSITVPFGIEKEFFLYAPADDSSIKFMKF